jgi:hypothetical protein
MAEKTERTVKARSVGIALDCPRKIPPWERSPNQYDPECKARFTDLEATSRPPRNIPPMLRKLMGIQGEMG